MHALLTELFSFRTVTLYGVAATSPESEISLYQLMNLVTRLGEKKNLPFSRKCQSLSHIWFGPNSVEASLTKNAFLI